MKKYLVVFLLSLSCALFSQELVNEPAPISVQLPGIENEPEFFSETDLIKNKMVQELNKYEDPEIIQQYADEVVELISELALSYQNLSEFNEAVNENLAIYTEMGLPSQVIKITKQYARKIASAAVEDSGSADRLFSEYDIGDANIYD